MEDRVTTLIAGASPDLVELSRELGKRGEQVALFSRNIGRLVDFKRRLEAFDVACEVFAADVTEGTSILQAFKKLAIWSKRLDRLIYNVGVISGESTAEGTGSELARQMSTNFYGFVNCFQLANPMFKRRGSGHAIVISGADTLCPETSSLAYGASKSSLMIYIAALRKELPAEIKLSEVYLGRVTVNPSGSRILRCEEIVAGLLQVLDEMPELQVIGET